MKSTFLKVSAIVRSSLNPDHCRGKWWHGLSACRPGRRRSTSCWSLELYWNLLLMTYLILRNCFDMTSQKKAAVFFFSVKGSSCLHRFTKCLRVRKDLEGILGTSVIRRNKFPQCEVAEVLREPSHFILTTYSVYITLCQYLVDWNQNWKNNIYTIPGPADKRLTGKGEKMTYSPALAATGSAWPAGV